MNRGWPLPGKKTASGLGPSVWHKQAWAVWWVPKKAGCRSGWRSWLEGAVAGEVVSCCFSATRQGQLRFPVAWFCTERFEFRQQHLEQHRSFDIRGMTHVFPPVKGTKKSAATSVAKIRFAEVDEMCTGFFPNPIKRRFPFQKNLRPKYDGFCPVYLRWRKGVRSDSAQSNLHRKSVGPLFGALPGLNQGLPRGKENPVSAGSLQTKKGSGCLKRGLKGGQIRETSD
jgi:hypothetical protein